MSEDWINTPNSSSVEAYTYDPQTMVLSVRFKSGGAYDYHGVPEGMVGQMAGADSIGKFIHSRIKPTFPAKKGGQL